MPDLTLSRLKLDEWEAYREIRLESLLDSSEAFGMSYEEEKRRSDLYWQQIVKRYAIGFFDWMFVAKIDGRIIGTTGAFCQPYTKKRHVITIINVYVRKQFRNQGIARQLFDHVLQFIKHDPQIIKIKLTVNPNQEKALKMYQNYGFEVVGKMKKELKINERFYDEWILEKWVE